MSKVHRLPRLNPRIVESSKQFLIIKEKMFRYTNFLTDFKENLFCTVRVIFLLFNIVSLVLLFKFALRRLKRYYLWVRIFTRRLTSCARTKRYFLIPHGKTFRSSSNFTIIGINPIPKFHQTFDSSIRL